MKTALIIGGTSGVGLSIAKGLLDKGYRVSIVGSNEEKGILVRSHLEIRHPGNVEFIHLDLSDLGRLFEFAHSFKKTHVSLDLLANIAGVMSAERRVTGEGIERTFAIGHLSAYILSTELVPLLEQAKSGRIVNVAGVPRFVFNAKLDFNDLGFSKDYSSFRTAITTVHAKTVMTEILAKQLATKGIDVNSFHPGAVQSELMQNMPSTTRRFFSFLSLFMTKESKTGNYVCESDRVSGITGSYFVKKKHTQLSFDESYKNRLFEETNKIIDKVRPSRVPTSNSVIETSVSD